MIHHFNQIFSIAVKEHVNMIRRHNYENTARPQQQLSPAPLQLQALSSTPLQQQPLSPTPQQQSHQAGRERVHTVSTARMNMQSNGTQYPMRSRASTSSVQLSASNKRGYENVVVLTATVPQYEQISSQLSPLQSPPPQPTLPYTTNSSQPLSPSPPLPDRNYLDSDLMSPPPGGMEERKTSTSSLQQPPPLHEVSSTGKEYAIIHPKHLQKKHQERERAKEDQEGGVTPEQEEAEPPPTLPLRAHQRMRSRENLLAEEGGVVSPQPPEASKTSMKTDHTPNDGPIAYSVVKLDAVSGRGEVSEEDLVSPQPYEVASPTPLSSSSAHPYPAPSSSTDPHYEEIEGASQDEGECACCWPSQ